MSWAQEISNWLLGSYKVRTTKLGDNTLLQHVVQVDTDGNPVSASGGTNSNFGATFPTAGTASGASDGTNMQPLLVDGSGYLRVNVSAGSGGNSAASATGSAVPASADYGGANVGGTLRGVTAVNPSGSIYAQQVDVASMAGTTADTNSGVKSAGTLRVVLATDQPQLTNKLLVTPDANSAVNVAQINGATPTMGNGVSGTGVQRVTIASDSTGVIAATQSGSWSLAANQSVNVAQINGVAATMGNGVSGTGVQRVTIASDSTGTVAATQSGSWSLAANQSVNVAQINGVAATMGNGVSGTGVQRVTIASDSTGTVAATQSGSWSLAANQSVNVAQINGVAATMGNGASGTGVQRVTIASDSTGVIGATQSGTWTVQPGNTANTTPWLITDSASSATGSAVPAKASYTGLLAQTANPTAATAGNLVGALADKLGKTIAVSAIRDLKGVQQTNINASTTETTIVTAVASTFLDLYGLIITNNSGTTTKVTIKDSTAGTTRMVYEVAGTLTVGFVIDCGSAVPQATVNTNWTATCGTSVNSVDITALYVKNT